MFGVFFSDLDLYGKKSKHMLGCCVFSMIQVGELRMENQHLKKTMRKVKEKIILTRILDDKLNAAETPKAAEDVKKGSSSSSSSLDTPINSMSVQLQPEISSGCSDNKHLAASFSRLSSHCIMSPGASEELSLQTEELSLPLNISLV
jgi:hypothetical protein